MTLKAYKEKRNFKKTPEPAGKTQKPGNNLPRFVIQKHHASRLHYDLRLEAGGVLISWAVPKGPSQNPAHKRLAMMVEDHPLDYYDFEGVIPKGNYGAGTVMIWDWGNYLLKDDTDPKKISKAVRAGLKNGKLHVVFNGNKIKGEFAIINTKKESNEWLFFKIKDEYTTTKSYDNEDISVKTNRSFSEIKKTAEDKNEIWLSPPDNSKIDLNGAKKTKMPQMVSPMLATSVDSPFDNKEWIFEIKWDGYRCISEVWGGKVEMYSRNLKSFNTKFESIHSSLSKISFNAIFDGEIVIVDEKGKSDFGLLQNYKLNKEGTLVYYIFDLLYFNEHDLTSLPLYRRKEILEEILPSLQHIRYSDHIPETGTAFFDMAVNMDLEGIIGKKKESKYQPGTRSNDWVKIKAQKRIEAVICGFTQPRGGRKYFGALVLGIYKKQKLEYIGHTGGGFSNSNLKSLHDKLNNIEVEQCPFEKTPTTNMPVTWVKPEFICEIKYLEITKDNILRNPIFLGLMEDKTLEDIKDDKTENNIRSINKGKVTKTKKSSPAEFSDLDELIKTNREDGILDINNIKLKLTNLNKVYWPELKYTKADLLKYYWDISDFILPHLKDRPESLNRYPNGIHGDSFYQKDMRDIPEWVETIKIPSDGGKKELNYLLCQNKASLMYLANLGCIELNPWSSRVDNLDFPDYTIIDLDPPDNLTFDNVKEVALVTKDVLDEAEIKSYIKTSGSTGMHILIPLNANYNYEQGRQFALLIGNLVYQRTLKLTSLERLTKKRGNKIYIDCLQNYAGQTIASAYCARPRLMATVSAPLEWNELNSDLSPADFTIKNMLSRLKEKGDIMTGIKTKRNDISKAIKNLENKLKS